PGASLTPVCRRGSRRATTRIRRRGQGEADRPVSCVGRLGSRGQACLEVRRGGGCLNPNISPAGAACNPTADHQQNPLQPAVLSIETKKKECLGTLYRDGKVSCQQAVKAFE